MHIKLIDFRNASSNIEKLIQKGTKGRKHSNKCTYKATLDTYVFCHVDIYIVVKRVKPGRLRAT